jgi:hypothetical protein
MEMKFLVWQDKASLQERSLSYNRERVAVIVLRRMTGINHV